MRIPRIKIKKFKRFALNGYDEIDMTFLSKVIIILGTNGSGKSSLFRLLTTLVPDKKEFEKDGHCIIEIIHNGCEYILTADFTKKHVYSFRKDGIEMNNGGKVTIQKDLVEQEFHIGQRDSLMMRGKTEFSRLKPNERKQLISMMADTDMTYAMHLYKTLEVKTRDLKGNIKYISGRISQEQAKKQELINAPSTYDPEKLREIIRNCSEILENSTVGVNAAEMLENQLQGQLREFDTLDEKLTGAMKRLDRMGPLPYLDGEQIQVADIDMAINHISAKISRAEGKMSIAVEEESKVLKELEEMGNIANAEQLHGELENVEQRIKQIDHVLVLDYSGIDVSTVHSTDMRFRNEITDLISRLDDNTSGKLNRARLNELEQLISIHTGEQEKLNKAYVDLNRKQVALENAHRVSCPKCKHGFRPGHADVTDEHVAKLSNDMDMLRDDITQIKRKIIEYKEEYQRISNYAAGLVKLNQLLSSKGMSAMIGELFDGGKMRFIPEVLSNVATTWMDQVGVAKNKKALEEQRDALRHRIDTLANINLDRVDTLESSANRLRLVISVLGREMQTDTKVLSSLKAIKRDNDSLDQHFAKFLSVEAELDETYNNLKSVYHVMAVRESMYAAQQQLTLLEGHTKNIEAVDAVIADLEKSLAELKEDYQYHQDLVLLMSPNKGIIAKTLGKFMSHLTNQVNGVIGGVYEYPFEVLPSKFDANEADVDYKFPFVLDDSPAESGDDIDDTSDGQREIVDFAFRILCLEHMRHADKPLFLDEPGRPQDETHADNMMKYIKSIADSEDTEQVFMISHHAATHGAFTDADVCVLNPSNITSPAGSNQHVLIS